MLGISKQTFHHKAPARHKNENFKNIAGRLPENSRYSFIKTLKKTDQNTRLFIEGRYIMF